jgi:acyl carrier protein
MARAAPGRAAMTGPAARAAGLDAARALLAQALAVAPATVPDDASLHTVPEWDSLGHVRIILALEAARGAPLPPLEAVSIESLADIARALAAAGRD